MNNQIPKNWQKVKLGEVADVQWGDVNLTKAAYKPSGYLTFSATGPDGFMDHYDFDHEGVVLSAIGANCGDTWFTQGKWAAIKNTIVFWAKRDKADTKFLFYKTHNKRLWPVRGSAQPFISQGDAREMELLVLRNIDEQKRISSMLSTYDEKIEANNKIGAVLEKMVQALFKEWFVKFRFPGYEKTEFVDSGLGKIPVGWKIGKLKELVNIRNGFAFISSDYESKGIPIVRTMNFTDKGSVQLNDNDIVYLSLEKAKKYRGFYLEKFDFLLVMVGASVGKWSVVPSNILPALQNQNMWDFMPKNEEYRFFNIYLLKKIIREQKGSTTGSARDFFRKDHFYSLSVFIPDSEILREFNNLVEPIYRRLDTILSENQKLAALRDLLLPKLMRGKIRI